MLATDVVRGRLGTVSNGLSATLISLVPSVTAETLAVCRIVLGGSLLYFLLQHDPSFLDSLAEKGPHLALSRALEGPQLLVVLSGSSSFRIGFYWTIILLTVLLIVGLRTRLVMPLLTGSLWAGALMANKGHSYTPLLLGMTATMFAPWGAAWSLDALRSRARLRTGSPLYGYAIWLLGLSIGLAYASAGLSKLWLTNGGWVWMTGARNGFLQDFSIGFTDLGILVSNSYGLSVLASMGSCFGQVAYVYSSFTRSEPIKYGICFLIALPFLAGLVIFMGHFWWPWAILVLILYLPWARIDRRIAGRLASRSAEFPATSDGQRHRSFFLATTSVLIGLHVFAVATAKEFEPIYSNYPMYIERLGMVANTDDEAEFWQRRVNASRTHRPVVHLLTEDGQERDVTLIYRINHFLRREVIIPSSYAELSAQTVYKLARERKPIPDHVCEGIREAARSMSNGTARFVRYNLHYFDLKSGVLAWRPLDPATAVTMDLASCAYR